MTTRLFFSLAAFAVVAAGSAVAQAEDAQFARPVEITTAGKTYVDVLYPSPVLHDLNGDGKQELIIGDLRGYLQVAKRDSATDSPEWGDSQMMQSVEGKDIKFSNW